MHSLCKNLERLKLCQESTGTPKWTLFYLLMLLLTVNGHLDAETLQGRVVQVIDGDTIIVLDRSEKQHAVRLKGIDAPELGQRYGRISQKFLGLYLTEKDVVVEYFDVDNRQQFVGKVLFKGRDLNLKQIKAGMAWHDKKYQNQQTPADRNAYASAEINAKRTRRGLWRENERIPPWVWRRRQR
jgi:endonuclease YncB( thermonuclease family)